MSNFLDFVKRYTKILENPKSKKYLLKDIPKILKFQSQRKNIFSSLSCRIEKLGI